jgi:hypothetical protein
MTTAEISSSRLANQNISESRFNSPREIVSWMGALQAQDSPMSRWAIGLRIPGTSEATVIEALNKGDILRTHVLRPTWHIVDAENIRWMLKLTGPVIKASMKARHTELELDNILLAKYFSIITEALEKGAHLTKEELTSELAAHNVSFDNNRAYHILMMAELEGLICSGELKKGKITYALLEERSKPVDISREEALSRLAGLYFQSHGPATLKDFAWWSGLPARDVKTAMESVKNEFDSFVTGSDTFWLSGDCKNGKPGETYLLPAFDEFIISYRDRTASLALVHNRKAVSDNGIFRPVIVMNGQVTGLWKRAIVKDKVVIEPEFFVRQNRKTRESVAMAAESFGKFLGKRIELIFNKA